MMKSKIVINKIDFEDLVSGKVVNKVGTKRTLFQEPEEIEIILSDIGYDFMLDFIWKKRDQFERKLKMEDSNGTQGD